VRLGNPRNKLRAKYYVDSREFSGLGCRENHTSFSVNGKGKMKKIAGIQHRGLSAGGGIEHQVSSIQNRASRIQHQVSSIQNRAFSINNQFSWLASQKGHSNGLVDEGSGFPRMLASGETFAKNTKPAKNSSCLRGDF